MKTKNSMDFYNRFERIKKRRSLFVCVCVWMNVMPLHVHWHDISIKFALTFTSFVLGFWWVPIFVVSFSICVRFSEVWMQKWGVQCNMCDIVDIYWNWYSTGFTWNWLTTIFMNYRYLFLCKFSAALLNFVRNRIKKFYSKKYSVTHKTTRVLRGILNPSELKVCKKYRTLRPLTELRAKV